MQLPEAAHRRPPLFDTEEPVPDLEGGCYEADRYHGNVKGLGCGFFGSVTESQNACDRFCNRQVAVLHEAGLGKSGEGDWARLAKSGLLQSVDPAYLQTHGFGQAGGGAFTLDEGLRPHLLRHAKQVKKAYDRGT